MRIEASNIKIINFYCINKDGNLVDMLLFNKTIKDTSVGIDLMLYPYISSVYLLKDESYLSLTLPRLFTIYNERYDIYHTNIIKEFEDFNKLFLEKLATYDKYVIEFSREGLYANHNKFIFIEDKGEGVKSFIYKTPKESMLLLEGVNFVDNSEEGYRSEVGIFTYENYKFIDFKKHIESKKLELLKGIEELDLRTESAMDLNILEGRNVYIL